MSKRKKIILFTIGNIDHPSSRIRAIQYIPYLEKDGFQVKWIPRIPKKPATKFEKLVSFPLGKRWFGVKQFLVFLFSNSDIFFIQKIFVPKWIFQLVKRRRIKIIFDFDDAIFLQKNLLDIDKYLKKKTITNLKYSDKTIVSTKYLSDWCNEQGYDSIVITTPVDYFDIKNRKSFNPFVIGWMGSSTNTVHLEEMKEPFQSLAREFNIEVLLVGANKDFKIDGVKVIHREWRLEKEKEYLSEMNMGIMPLLKNNYSKGKGGYKIFVYMAAGLPVTATPIGINSEIIIENETGFLAETAEDWKMHITQFIENPNMARKFGQRAKEIASDKYSRNVCYDSLLMLIRD